VALSGPRGSTEHLHFFLNTPYMRSVLHGRIETCRGNGDETESTGSSGQFEFRSAIVGNIFSLNAHTAKVAA